MCVYVYAYVCIYIEIEREREREIDKHAAIRADHRERLTMTLGWPLEKPPRHYYYYNYYYYYHYFYYNYIIIIIMINSQIYRVLPLGYKVGRPGWHRTRGEFKLFIVYQFTLHRII